MRTGRAASRLPTLAAVAAAHIAVLLGLLSLTRPHALASPDLTSVLVWLPNPAAPPARNTRVAPAPPGRRGHPPATRPNFVSGASAPTAPPVDDSNAIDWAAAGEAAASAAADADERTRRRERDFTHPRSDTFAPTPVRPEFHWDRTHTERIVPLEGGGTLIRLNENCVLVVLLVPFPACALGRIPPRGDLLEHMPNAPESGARADR